MVIHRNISEHDLSNGLENDEFFLAFQPIMNLKSDSFETFEAFIRWKHPTLGELLPASFMNKIEEYNLSEKLTQRVIDCAVEQILNNHNAGYGETGVNVNLTMQEFFNPNTITQVMRAVKNIPDPAFLGLEISPKIFHIYPENNPEDDEYHPDCVPSDAESVFLADVKKICDQFIDLGVTLALDTTEHIIGGLIRADILGLHALKMRIQTSNDNNILDENILGKYIQASKDFRIPIVAMGVEEENLFKMIYNNHVVYAQGTFFCPPVVLNDPKKFKRYLDSYFFIKKDLLQNKMTQEIESHLLHNAQATQSDTENSLNNQKDTNNAVPPSFSLASGFGNRFSFGKKRN